MNGIGSNLKKIRLLRNLSLKEAGNLLNMSAPAVAKYEKGEIVPDSQKLIQFAKAYKVKTADLLKSYVYPKMKFLSFRKRKSLVGQNLFLLEELIQEEVAKNLEVLELSNIKDKKIKLPKYKCSSVDEAEMAAISFRKNIIQISSILPISNITNILESLGFILIEIENPDNRFDKFDGLSEVVNGYPIIVTLKDVRDGARQRFTIAHELGHLLLELESCDEKEIEKFCNRFASALLIPKESLINVFGEKRTDIKFFEFDSFKKEYKVSYTSIAYRLRDLEVISEYLYRNISIQLNKYVGKYDPNPILPEISQQYKRNVYKLEAEGIIGVKKACQLLGVDSL